jgi:two-component system, LytTR family, sensor kinase
MRVSAKNPGSLILSSGRPLPHDTLFWTLQTGGWLVFGLVMSGYERPWQDPWTAAADIAAGVAAGFALTTFFRALYRRQRRRTSSPLVLLGMSIVLALAGSPAWYLLQKLLLGMPLGRGGVDPAHPDWLWSSFKSEAFLYYAFILLTWTLLYFSINGWISLELERRRANRAEATALSARLQALQSQLEPHFLFNTLNGISALVTEGRNDSATAMIARLSDFLRLTLETTGTPEIPLADDLVFVRQYLDIQQLRFGDRLRFTFAIAPQAMAVLVPALLLQPLVENAVRHGILPRASGGIVIVSARIVAGALLLNIDDDGPGMQKSVAPSSGLGLSNTATRLAALYGGLAELSIGRSEAGGVGVAIRIPLRVGPDGGRPIRIDSEEE